MSSTFDPPESVPTKYWHVLDSGLVQCDLCPRFCKLNEGQSGFCFVRGCEDGEVVLKSYGRSSGYCVDPIEKKLLNHYLPGTSVLSFGSAGCNPGNRFCQNWNMSESRAAGMPADSASPSAIAMVAAELGCRSVAFTFNDPVVFHEYAIDVAQQCREQGIRSIAVTAGEVCAEPREEFYRHMDAANVALKAFTERFYQDVCGGAHLQPVLETLGYLKHETDVWLETTTEIIPGENDSDEELDEMTRWVVRELGPDVPMHFTGFHPDIQMLNKPPTPLATLRRAQTIAKKNGVRHVYIGNTADDKANSTNCHNCGHCLIGRTGYDLTKWNLTTDSKCEGCDAPCAGVFEPRPGAWGSRFLANHTQDYA